MLWPNSLLASEIKRGKIKWEQNFHVVKKPYEASFSSDYHITKPQELAKQFEFS